MGGTTSYSHFERDWRQEWTWRKEKVFGERVRLVNLDNTRVSDLSPLAEFKFLYSLRLENSPVRDLSPVAELKNLRLLYLKNTQVSDLSPLTELKNLQWISLENTQVSDEQLHELIEALPNCQFHR